MKFFLRQEDLVAWFRTIFLFVMKTFVDQSLSSRKSISQSDCKDRSTSLNTFSKRLNDKFLNFIKISEELFVHVVLRDASQKNSKFIKLEKVRNRLIVWFQF